MKKDHIKKDDKFTYCGLLHYKTSHLDNLTNISCVSLTDKKPIDFSFLFDKFKCIKCHKAYLKNKKVIENE